MPLTAEPRIFCAESPGDIKPDDFFLPRAEGRKWRPLLELPLAEAGNSGDGIELYDTGENIAGDGKEALL
jgi:hypothetical protein